MFSKKSLLATVLAASLLTPTISFAAAPSASDCVLTDLEVSSVKAYRVTKQIGKARVQRLAGAEIYVPAAPGLTAEWLRAQVDEHLRQMKSADMKDCVFDMADVRVTVDSAGSGFSVKVIAPKASQAKEVLRRAHALARS